MHNELEHGVRSFAEVADGATRLGLSGTAAVLGGLGTADGTFLGVVRLLGQVGIVGVAAVVLLWYALLRRRIGPASLAAGGLIWLAVLAAVLAAFADVEDQLTGSRVLERTEQLRQQASAIADENERLVLNRYKAGQVVYSEVVTAQASALSARRTLIQAQRDRQTTAVALIQSLGGGWSGAADTATP